MIANFRDLPTSRPSDFAPDRTSPNRYKVSGGEPYQSSCRWNAKLSTWCGTRGRRFKSSFPDQFFPATYGSGEHLEADPPGFCPGALALEPA